jgi:hypothetical protein
VYFLGVFIRIYDHYSLALSAWVVIAFSVANFLLQYFHYMQLSLLCGVLLVGRVDDLFYFVGG